LTPKTYGLTPRNPSCAAQYPRYWIRKVDGGHLGKWRRVRIAHTSDDVITQFRDPHTPMIDFSHADKCCYSAAGTLLFLGASAAALKTPEPIHLKFGKFDYVYCPT